MKIHDFRGFWKKRRLRLFVLAIAGCYGLYVLLGFFALPPILRWAMQTKGGQALGRPVSVQHVAFNPFTLTADVEGLRIADIDDRQDFVRVGHLHLDLSLASVWYRGLVLEQLRIDHPYVHVRRLDAERFNFSDIADRYAAPATPAKIQPKQTPFPFSLNNIEVTDGEFVFDDEPVKRVHRLSRLQLGIPFLSDLPAHVESFVRPHVSADLNGTDLRLEGQVKPFADHQEATLDLQLDTLDLEPYLVYLPAGMPVQIQKAKLFANLKMVWGRSTQGGAGKLSVAGKVGLRDTVLKDYRARDLLTLKGLDVGITQLEPLAHPFIANLSTVTLDAPQLQVIRDKAGRINLADWGADAGRSGPGKAVSQTTSSGGKAAASSDAPQIRIGQFLITNGNLHWKDDSVPGGFQNSLQNIEIQVSKFDLQAKDPAHLKATADGLHKERLEIGGDFSVHAARYEGQIMLSGVDIGALRPYYGEYMGPGLVRGKAGAKGHFLIAAGKEPALLFDEWALSLTDASLSDVRSKEFPVQLPDTQATGVRLDIQNHVFHLGRLKSRNALIHLQRQKTGALPVLGLVQVQNRHTGGVAPDNAKAKHPPARKKDAGTSSPWHVSLGSLELENWKVAFEDFSGMKPVALKLSELGFKVSNWDNRPHSQAVIELSANVNKTGKLVVKGDVATQPMKGRLRLDVQNVGMLSAQPYIDNLFRILVTKGKVSAHGQMDFDLTDQGKPKLNYLGNLSVKDFSSLDRLNNTDFMRWKNFSLSGVDFRLLPLALRTKEVRLEDFYSRLILSEKGQLNVRELMGAEEASGISSVSGPATVPASEPVADVDPKVRPSSPAPFVSIDKIILADGHISYNDRFVKPNYFANLLAVEGEIDGLSSDQTTVAKLDLKARMDGAAPVTVKGQLNPFRQDDFLDIKADVQDVDLVGASTYSAKYVGYGIEKGKLSMSVEYKIRDRKLTAENEVVLNQLTFGKKVDSPDATSLPVLFAVALLKDRHGVIDVNLPVSGSLDDPEFSIGGVVVKVIVNLISKAVTSPFALIGSAFGGGEELSYLEFAPGSAAISKTGEEKLNTLTKALLDRPGLKLEIAGRADPVTDVPGLKRTRLNYQVKSLKAGQMRKQGETVERMSDLKLSPEEYAELLTRLYETQKIDARPRNSLGLLKKQSVEEMEKIVMGSYVISEEDLQQLADWRARSVRNRLLKQEGIGTDRIFLLSSSDAAKSKDGKPAQARVEFLLK